MEAICLPCSTTYGMMKRKKEKQKRYSGIHPKPAGRDITSIDFLEEYAAVMIN